MATITRFKFQKNKQRVNVYLDDKFAFGLAADSLLKYGLKVGQELTNAKVRELKGLDIQDKFLARALKYLSYRPRSEREVIDYLKRRGGGQGSIKNIKNIIDKLIDLKLIDDQVFACWWLEQRSAFRPRGKVALKAELIKKGVDRGLIEKVLDEKVDELPLAKKALRKKLKLRRRLQPEEFRRKSTAYLSRLGFSWSIVKEALEEIEEMV